MKYNPSEYQTAATDFILKHDHCGLFLQMGLGKTVITLTAIDQLLMTGEAEHVLVVAPLNVARTVWAEETEKWDHLQGINVVKILGSAEKRKAAIAEKADIHIINRDNLVWLVEYMRKQGHGWPWDMLVIDELSSFKEHKTARFKAVAKVLPVTRRVVGLTGTPAPNGLMDLWAEIYLLDRGLRLGRTITQYRNLYFRPGRSNGHVVYEYLPLPGADGAVQRQISDICMSMSAEDYVKLPDRIYREVTVELPEKVMKVYKAMERDMIMTLQGTEITAASAAVVCNKLLQLSSGAVYDEDGQVHVVHDEKIKALQEIVDTATSPVLIFYAFKHDRDRLKQALPEAVELRGEEDIRQWNSGRIRALLAHPASAGHGLNLQAGGHIVVWYSLTWSLEQYQQANARLWRRGQQETVIIHHLVGKGTMDEDVLRALDRKDHTQAALMEAVKARIEKITGDEVRA